MADLHAKSRSESPTTKDAWLKKKKKSEIVPANCRLILKFGTAREPFLNHITVSINPLWTFYAPKVVVRWLAKVLGSTFDPHCTEIRSFLCVLVLCLHLYL